MRRIPWEIVALIVWPLVALCDLVRGREVEIQRVIDGDTLVCVGGERLRLFGVDAPELKQVSGPPAKLALERACLDKTVVVLRERAGAYHRTDVVIKAGKWNVNEQMLRYGRVWCSPTYCPPDLRDRYQGLQDDARAKRRGLWVIDQPMPPWEFRRRSGAIDGQVSEVVQLPGLSSPLTAPPPPTLLIDPKWCVGST